jgi:hypothetical protein
MASDVPLGGGSSSADDTAELRGAALFKLIWDAVADVLGNTATATLLRRAAKRATLRSPELGEFTVLATDAGYTYALPRVLVGRVEHTPVALRELVGELRPLLLELTGQIVVRRIEQIPELQERGVFSPAEGFR